MLNNSKLDAVFRALAVPARRDMVEALAESPQLVSTLARRYDMSLSAVSQHLSVLVDAGLVISQRRGRTNLCSLNHESIGAIEEWVATRKRALDLRLQRFADYLDAEKGPMQ